MVNGRLLVICFNTLSWTDDFVDNLVVSSLLLIAVTSIFLNLLVFASDRCANIHKQHAGWSGSPQNSS